MHILQNGMRAKVWLPIFAILMLASCTGTSNSARRSVRLMVWGDPAEQAAFKSVVDGFHQFQNSQNGTPFEIDLIALPSKGDYLTRLTTDFAAGSPPDVFLLNYRRLALFHNRDAIEPLGPMVDASTLIDENDYFEIALDAFRDSNGTLLCFPQNISSQVVYFNRDLFDQAQVPYPAIDWTWEDLRNTALILTLPDQNGDDEPDQYGLGLEPHLIRMAPFIWQNYGRLVDDPETPTKITLDTEAAETAIRFVLDLALESQVVPNRTAEAVQSHRDRFYSGNIAMYIDSRRIVPTLREVASFNWDVAPLPRQKVQANVLHSDGYCMAAASTVQAAAWRFIEYAVSDDGQIRAAQLGRTVPSSRAVATSMHFLDPNKAPANAHFWLDAIPSLRILPRLSNWARVERTAGIELELAYLGLRTYRQAIDTIQAQANQEFMPIK